MLHLAQAVGEDTARYFLDDQEATLLARRAGEFAAALSRATDNAARTMPVVREKEQARRVAERLCRRVCSRVKQDDRVSDSDKIAVGVRPPAGGRGATPGPPATMPLLRVIAATPGRHTLAYADAATPTRKAMPRGAACLHLDLGDGCTADVNEARFYRSFTRTPLTVELAPGDGGKAATYFARWATRRGEVGP